jgi:hypothetical protein
VRGSSENPKLTDVSTTFGDAMKVIENRSPQMPDYGYHPSADELNKENLPLDAHNKSITHVIGQLLPLYAPF